MSTLFIHLRALRYAAGSRACERNLYALVVCLLFAGGPVLGCLVQHCSEQPGNTADPEQQLSRAEVRDEWDCIVKNK